MGIKQGYKQTDIGIFPNDWDISQIQTVASVRTGPFGSALHEKDYVQDGTPIITVEHLGEFDVTHSNIPMVSDNDKRRLEAFSLLKGDIVFSRVGSVDRNALISEKEDGWLFSGRLLRIRVQNNRAYSPFLSYYFHSESFMRRVRNMAVGQTMPSLNTQIIRNIGIILPPQLEQLAIAAALRDVDALISALDALIAKKRAIKQGAMQELLTGKTRLPGCSGKWEMKKLGSFVQVTMGQSPRSANYNTKGIGLPLIQGNADVENRRTIIRTYTSEITRKCFVGDIIMSVRAPVGLIAKTEFEACLGRGVCAMRYPNDYLYFYLIGQEANWVKISKGSTFDSVTSADIRAFEVYFPEEEEQRAIAAVLSDMEAEISTLEQQREKTRLLKQGMMQELLTGKTRLNHD